MNIIRTILLFTLLTLIVEAGWKPLKQVEDYPGNAYTLKENVAYMEIRLYKSKKSERANKIITLYRKPLSNYPKNVISKFKNLEKKYSNKESYLQIRNYGNAFFIDTNGKMFWTDETKDIKMLLGQVDTPAELALALWLTYENGWQTYKKTSHGYKIKRSTWISKCMDDSVTGTVDRKGNTEMGNDVRHVIRKKCNKRKYTQFISNKKVDYESYNHIAMDDSENLYVVGWVNENKTYHSEYYMVLDKYNNHGKRLWSRKLTGNVIDSLLVVNDFVYLGRNNKIEAKYSFEGKKISFKKGEIVTKRKQKESIKYTPQLLSDEKKNIEFSMLDQIVSKKGNVYVVGLETFYPNSIPTGTEMCGNNGQVDGAVIVKFSSKGKMLWAKTIDRDN